MWWQAGLLDHFTARNKSNLGLLAQRVALYSGLFVVHPPDFCNYLANSSCEMEMLPHPTDANVSVAHAWGCVWGKRGGQTAAGF